MPGKEIWNIKLQNANKKRVFHSAKNDVRPGLLFRHADKRCNNLQKRKFEKDEESRQPKKGKLEAERRQIGLEQPLGQDNKGFALLQKMGFTPGT